MMKLFSQLENKIVLVITSFLFSGVSSIYASEILYKKIDVTIGQARDYVTESEFEQVLYYIQQIYSPDVYRKGHVSLDIRGFWNDDQVNAFALREPGVWAVNIYGGIARAEGMNADSLAFIVCHEVGHHLAGAPLTFKYDGWPSAEGQADYWATSKCLKKYYSHLLNENFVLDEGIPKKAIDACGDVYYSSTDYRICLRTMNAVKAFERFLNGLPNTKTSVSILTPDKKIVKGTNHNDYPRAQCRLDTAYNGALCYLDTSIFTSDRDPKMGHCNETNKPGARPQCWYKH